jgi:uncharacterized membrane protein YgdD (TMEM256/DUF423 family)
MTDVPTEPLISRIAPSRVETMMVGIVLFPGSEIARTMRAHDIIGRTTDK